MNERATRVYAIIWSSVDPDLRRQFPVGFTWTDPQPKALYDWIMRIARHAHSWYCELHLLDSASFVRDWNRIDDVEMQEWYRRLSLAQCAGVNEGNTRVKRLTYSMINHAL